MKYENLHEAYLGTLADVYDNPQFECAPRGQLIKEILDYKFVIENPVAEPIVTHDSKRNETIKSYTEKECDLYNSGTNSAEDFGKASKFWLKLANPDGTVNSAYGHLIKHKKSHGNPIYELDQEIKDAPDLEAVSSILTGDRPAEVMRTPWEWCKDAAYV